jgi:dephospho-CoA kinase
MGHLNTKTIGITGGIGSGKSTVCRMLESWGAHVYYSDDEAKRLMVEDSVLRDELAAAFGPETYHADGSLNRAFLAGKVFGDAEQLAVLNGLVHPRVYASFARFEKAAKSSGAPLVVRESAVMPEGKATEGLDALVVVTAAEDTRLARVTRRDGSKESEVRKRMNHQDSDSTFEERADRILRNDGSLEDLKQATAELYRNLTGTEPDTVSTGSPYATPASNLPVWGNSLTRVIGKLILGLTGFRWVGPFPNLKKFVLIGAPHTTNWDFILGMALLLATGVRVNWIGKHTIFRPPFGGFMRWLGGVAVDRRRTDGLVAQVSQAIKDADRMVIGLAPEGTRKHVERWKTGFYRIAVSAGVPIVIGMIDFGRKELRVDSVFEPTGDMEADIAAIRARYEGVRGKYAEKSST